VRNYAACALEKQKKRDPGQILEDLELPETLTATVRTCPCLPLKSTQVPAAEMATYQQRQK
jgi:hypothetical protein